MECPYCAEEIKDQAVVCKHCGNPIAILRGLTARVERLERQERESSNSLPEPPPQPSWIHAAALPALGILACLFWTASAYWIELPPDSWNPNVPYLLVILAPPLIFGLLAGAAWQRSSWPHKLSVGVVLGLLNLVAILFITSDVNAEYNWPWALAVFNLGQPAIFASATWISELIRATWPARPPTPANLLGKGRFLAALSLQLIAQVATALTHIQLIRKTLP